MQTDEQQRFFNAPVTLPIYKQMQLAILFMYRICQALTKSLMHALVPKSSCMDQNQIQLLKTVWSQTANQSDKDYRTAWSVNGYYFVSFHLFFPPIIVLVYQYYLLSIPSASPVHSLFLMKDSLKIESISNNTAFTKTCQTSFQRIHRLHFFSLYFNRNK